MNTFFQNANKTLSITEKSYLTKSTTEILNLADKAIFTYKNHTTILAIKKMRQA